MCEIIHLPVNISLYSFPSKISFMIPVSLDLVDLYPFKACKMLSVSINMKHFVFHAVTILMESIITILKVEVA